MKFSVKLGLLTSALMLAVTAYPNDKAVQEQIAKAARLYEAGQFEDATRSYKDAVAAMRNPSQPALLGLAKAYRSIGAWEMCVESALKAATAGGTNVQRADGHWMAGLCYTELRDKDGSYAKAEQELRAALRLAPENQEVHVSIGTLFMRQKRDAEGVAEMKLYLEKRPSGELAQIAQSLMQAPGLARLEFMPEFRIKTVDNRTITTKDLAGKVVLIDFWAPWCAPCKAAIPHLRSLLKEYSGQPFEVVSVCGDEKEEVWYRFVQENALEWPQYYDRYATMRRLFHVTNYPTYIIVDANGVIRTKVIGIGDRQLAFVEDELKSVISETHRPLK